MKQVLPFVFKACRNPSFALAVRTAGGLEILSPFLATSGVEKLQTAFVMSFVVGREESLSSGISLLSMFPELVNLLVEVFTLTLDLRDGDDFKLGAFGIPQIVAAILALSIADANKSKLVDAPLLPLLIRVLQLYQSNAPELQKSYVCTFAFIYSFFSSITRSLVCSHVQKTS
jgi:hypothetical protein